MAGPVRFVGGWLQRASREIFQQNRGQKTSKLRCPNGLSKSTIDGEVVNVHAREPMKSDASAGHLTLVHPTSRT